MRLTPSRYMLLMAAAFLMGLAACEEFEEAVAPPGPVNVQVALEVVMADFPTEQFGDATNPGLAQEMEVCQNLKPNVFFQTENTEGGPVITMIGDDVLVQNVPSAPKPRCRFIANILRASASYDFMANVSATPLSTQGWQTTCTFEVQHPDLKNAPGNPVWENQHWVFFFLDQTITPPIRNECCTAQAHIDNQPEPPGFPEMISNCAGTPPQPPLPE